MISRKNFILDNAIDSIILGLEDYKSVKGDSKRILSAARNIFAGILLLFKYKLVLLSPEGSDEVLIKQKILPKIDNPYNNKLHWKGIGKKTVDVQAIKERFESLDIYVDWERLDKVNQYRNDIEHYYSSASVSSVEAIISDCFIVIKDFLTRELGLDPVKVLGSDNWSILLEVHEVYESQEIACILELDSLDYGTGELDMLIQPAIQNGFCPKCESALLTTKPNIGTKVSDAEFTCGECGEDFNYKDLLCRLIPAYYLYGDGAEMSSAEDLKPCIHCKNMTYFYNVNECAFCSYKSDIKCEKCEAVLLSKECRYCEICEKSIKDGI